MAKLTNAQLTAELESLRTAYQAMEQRALIAEQRVSELHQDFMRAAREHSEVLTTVQAELDSLSKVAKVTHDVTKLNARRPEGEPSAYRLALARARALAMSTGRTVRVG